MTLETTRRCENRSPHRCHQCTTPYTYTYSPISTLTLLALQPPPIVTLACRFLLCYRGRYRGRQLLCYRGRHRRGQRGGIKSGSDQTTALVVIGQPSHTITPPSQHLHTHLAVLPPTPSHW